MTAASRDSSGAVLAALERTLRTVEPALDAVLIFVPAGENLHCIYAGGPRTEHFTQLRLSRDGSPTIPARAAQCLHRVVMSAQAEAVIPTDRAALAVPMVEGGACSAVVYAASALAPIRDPDGIVRAVAQACAPFALAAEREHDRAQATFDALTGLYTPRAFRDRLYEDLRVAHLRGRDSIALWFVDTDRFKAVNDTLGHACGDRVLQQMAGLLRAHTIEGNDVAARNGGDEFCAILHDTQKASAIERAHRLCCAVRGFDFGIKVPITASIGVAAFPYDAREAGELLELADAAMYHSKRSGRDQVSFITGSGGFAVYR